MLQSKMRHFSGFDVICQLWGKKCRAGRIDASSCIEGTCGSAHGCSDNAITEAKFVRQFGTYCNIRRVRCKWKLFAVEYR